jgi:hypothetical protein
MINSLIAYGPLVTPKTYGLNTVPRRLRRKFIRCACVHERLHGHPTRVARSGHETLLFRVNVLGYNALYSVLSQPLPPSRWFLSWLIIRPWIWRRHIPPKCRLTFNGLPGVTSQKIDPFSTTAVRTSKPTLLFNLAIRTWQHKLRRNSIFISSRPPTGNWKLRLQLFTVLKISFTCSLWTPAQRL